MTSSVVLKVALVVLTCMVVAAPYGEASIGCSQVVADLMPCLGYLTGSGPLPANCCAGVKALNDAAQTTPDRQTACQCIKDLAGKTPGINFSLAAGLPGKCGVTVSYPISPSIDCKKIK